MCHQEPNWTEAKSHCLHLKDFSLEWTFRCALKLPDWILIFNKDTQLNIYSPSYLGTHIEERYITIFCMQNNSQIIMCEIISRHWFALTDDFQPRSFYVTFCRSNRADIHCTRARCRFPGIPVAVPESTAVHRSYRVCFLMMSYIVPRLYL